jgi:hypothetical protein
MARNVQQPLGKDSFTDADLEHDVRVLQLRVAHDCVEEVRVGEEVLTQANHSGYQPKRARAFDSTTRSSSS